LYRAPFFREGAIGMSALSGIDQALHDIGRRSWAPALRLLAVRSGTVRFYDHLAGGSSALYDPANVERFGELALQSIADGHGIKILCRPARQPRSTLQRLSAT